jgi:hypothetical protein
MEKKTHAQAPPPPISILVRAETDDPWSSDILPIELYTLHPNPDYTPSDNSQMTSMVENAVMTLSSFPSSPYIFPPILTSKVVSRRGALRCKEIILGRLGTALWIQPKDRSAAGLYWTTEDAPPVGPENIISSEHKNESLVVTVFPGSLFQGSGKEDDIQEGNAVSEMKGKVICWNDRHSWSSIDYDEEVGRIVLGTSFGEITILDL